MFNSKQSNEEQYKEGSWSDPATKDVSNPHLFDPKVANKVRKRRKRLIILAIVVVLIVVGWISSAISDHKEAKEKEKEVQETISQKLEWPSDSVLAKKLPKPASKNGTIDLDDEDEFEASVYKISKTAFSDYVKQCKKKGFTVGYSATSDSYKALNEEGDELTLMYTEDLNDIVYLSIELNSAKKMAELKAEEEKEDAKETAKEEKKETKSSAKTDDKSINTGGVTPEFKETMDSYKAFFDKYVDFMNKYSEADSSTKAGMISDYTKLMQQYNDYMNKLDAIDSKNLSTADLAYYEKVNAEILKELSEVK